MPEQVNRITVQYNSDIAVKLQKENKEWTKTKERLRDAAKAYAELEGVQKGAILTTSEMSKSGERNIATFKKTDKTMRFVVGTTSDLTKETKILVQAEKQKNIAIAQGQRAYASYLEVKAKNLAMFKKEDAAQRMNIALDKKAAAEKKRLADATVRAANRHKIASERMSKANRGVSLSAKGLAQAIELLAVRRLAHQLVSAMREGITVTIEFHKALTEVQTIAQSNQATIESWGKSISNVAKAWDLDLIDTANARYEILSNQIAKGTEATEAFSNSSAKFAKITRSTVEDSVNLLTAALNAYGDTAYEVERVSATFFKTIELGRIRSKDLANTMGKVLVPAAQLGIDLEEVAAMMATITIKGVKANETMTLLRGVMVKLMKPTGDLEDLFKKWGVRTGEQAIATYGLYGVMQLLEEATRGTGSEIAKLFGRIRATMGVTAVISDLDKFKDTLEEIRTASGIAYNAAGLLQFQTAGEQVSKELNKLKIEFTEAFGGTSIQAMAWFNANVLAISDSVFLLTKIAGAMALAMASLWVVKRIELMRLAIVQLTVNMQLARVSITTTAGAVLGLKVAMTALPLLATAAAFAVIKIATSAIAAEKGMQRLRDEYELLNKESKSLSTESIDKFTESIGFWSDNIKEMYQTLAGVSARFNAATNEITDALEIDADWIKEQTIIIDEYIDNTIDQYQEMYNTLIDLKEEYQKNILKLENEQARDAKSAAAFILGEEREHMTSQQIKESFAEEIQGYSDTAAAAEAGSAAKIAALKEELKAREQLIQAIDKADAEATKQAEARRKQSGFGTGRRDRDVPQLSAEKKEELEEYKILAAELATEQQKAIDIEQAHWDNVQDNLAKIKEDYIEILDLMNKTLVAMGKPELANKLIDKDTRETWKKIIESGGTIGVDFNLEEMKNLFEEFIERSERVAPLNEMQKTIETADTSINELRKVLEDQISETKDQSKKALAAESKALQDRTSSIKKILETAGVAGRSLFQKDLLKMLTGSDISSMSGALIDVSVILKDIADDLKVDERGKILGTEEDMQKFLDELPEKIAQAVKEAGEVQGPSRGDSGYSKKVREDLKIAMSLLQEELKKALATGPALEEAKKEKERLVDVLAEQKEMYQGLTTVGQQFLDWQTNNLLELKDKNAQELQYMAERVVTFGTAIDLMSKKIEQATLELQTSALPRAGGGSIWGTDTVPVRLTPGEFVMNQRAAAKFYGQLTSMNAGGFGQAGGDYSTNVGDISINVQGGNTESQSISNIMTGIRRGIHRGQLGGL